MSVWRPISLPTRARTQHHRRVLACPSAGLEFVLSLGYSYFAGEGERPCHAAFGMLVEFF
jgi:hypothetical protein